MTAGSDLASKLADAGVTKLVFVRHANAEPPGNKAKGEYGHIHDWHRDDQLRPLTPKGKEMAQAARGWFHTATNGANKVLATSGARRASETLQIMTEQKVEGGAGGLSKILGCAAADVVATQAAMDLVGSLHPAGIAPKCEEMFDTMGYGPLTKFYAKDGGKQAFQEYAEIVAKDLGSLCTKVAKNPGNTISCWGHAVFLNAIAMLVCEQAWDASPETIKHLSEMDLGEAQGILLERKNNTVVLTHLKA